MIIVKGRLMKAEKKETKKGVPYTELRIMDQKEIEIHKVFDYTMRSWKNGEDVEVNIRVDEKTMMFCV